MSGVAGDVGLGRPTLGERLVRSLRGTAPIFLAQPENQTAHFYPSIEFMGVFGIFATQRHSASKGFKLYARFGYPSSDKIVAYCVNSVFRQFQI